MELTNYNQDRKQRRKPGGDASFLSVARVQPQARELEEAILGAIMLEKTAFDVASEILVPECFYVEAHQTIYKAMLALTNKSMPIDLLTVVEELRFQENLDRVGGVYAVTKLTNAVVSAANIDAHCRIVIQKYIQRELIRISGEIIGEAYEDSTDVFDLLDSAEGKLF
ncbi:MAG: replicative DNA helicase, partial [Ferruginibacter sp.]